MVHAIIGILSAFLIFSYGYFYTLTCVINDYSLSTDAYTKEVFNPQSTMIWISFTLLAIIFFTVGCIML